MWSLVLVCAMTIPPRVRLIEIAAFILVIYIAISAMVPVCEITVTEHGLIIHRLILRERFVPWSAIDRVLIFGHEALPARDSFEVTSIGIYEGLSPLNRLPGLLYGQGLRQTIIVMPDAIEGYDQLIDALSHHCAVFRSHPS